MTAPTKPTSTDAYRFADAIGIFSLVLGAAELFAPRFVARSIGSERTAVVRLFGLREIATGIGILASANPKPWLWARVAGDALDLATLAAAGDLSRRGARFAFAAVTAATMVDVVCAKRLDSVDDRPRRDYSDRVGFNRTPEEMRGAARAD